jgi:hypothetical protein
VNKKPSAKVLFFLGAAIFWVSRTFVLLSFQSFCPDKKSGQKGFSLPSGLMKIVFVFIRIKLLTFL